MFLNEKTSTGLAFGIEAVEVISLTQTLVGFSGNEFYFLSFASTANKIVLVSVF